MDIPSGNFTDEDIKKANKEFNRIIDNLKNNKIFNRYFSDLDNENKKKTKIEIVNLDERLAGETTRNNKNNDRTISFNSSIYDRLKETFTKLCLGKDLDEMDAININYFVHEYLHNRQIYLFNLNGFIRNLSEGLTEIIAQRYTNNFLKTFCGDTIKYKKVTDTFIYRDVVNVMKPLLLEFKDEKIYDDIENMLEIVNHNNIFENLLKVINGYDKRLSITIVMTLREKLQKNK